MEKITTTVANGIDKSEIEMTSEYINLKVNPIRHRGFEVVKDSMRKHSDVEIELPKRGTSKSAGYDIKTPIDIIIPPYGESKLIATDIKAYMQDDEVLEVHVRSSIGIKKGLMLMNTTGVIDA